MGQNHGNLILNYNRAFAIGVALNVAFVVLEAVFGFIANSLALLADAAHNLSDVIGLLLAWGASYLAGGGRSERRTYGLRKSTILAALLNALILLAAVGGITWEAIRRFGNPSEPTGWTIIVVAGVGVIINTLTALLFIKGRKGDINIRGAFLHMAADAGVSLGVVVAGTAIMLTGWGWIDPVTSLLVAAVIFYSTWGLLKSSVNLALDAVPEDIDPREVEKYLEGLPGVEGVHDLHIWGMSTTESALTAHLVKPDPENDDRLVQKVCKELHEQFGIIHSTIQWERSMEMRPCEMVDEKRI